MSLSQANMRFKRFYSYLPMWPHFSPLFLIVCSSHSAGVIFYRLTFLGSILIVTVSLRGEPKILTMPESLHHLAPASLWSPFLTHYLFLNPCYSLMFLLYAQGAPTSGPCSLLSWYPFQAPLGSPLFFRSLLIGHRKGEAYLSIYMK